PLHCRPGDAMGGDFAFFRWLFMKANPNAVEGAEIDLLRVHRKVRPDGRRKIINRSVGHSALLSSASKLISGISILTRIKWWKDLETTLFALPDDGGHGASQETARCRAQRPHAIEAVTFVSN